MQWPYPLSSPSPWLRPFLSEPLSLSPPFFHKHHQTVHFFKKIKHKFYFKFNITGKTITHYCICTVNVCFLLNIFHFKQNTYLIQLKDYTLHIIFFQSFWLRERVFLLKIHISKHKSIFKKYFRLYLTNISIPAQDNIYTGRYLNSSSLFLTTPEASSRFLMRSRYSSFTRSRQSCSMLIELSRISWILARSAVTSVSEKEIINTWWFKAK